MVLPPGYHFIFFPTANKEEDALHDGYEKYFAPRGDFVRRLWTQGRLLFNNGKNVSKREKMEEGKKEEVSKRGKEGEGEGGLMVGEWAECVERVEDVIVDKENKAIDVWTSRTMYSAANEGRMKGTDDDWSVRELRCLRYLRQFPPTPQEPPPEPETSTSHETPYSSPGSVSKEYEKATREAFLIHHFTPSQILLTRYSYLTFNLHKIHIDPEYAQRVEGYPSTLVHGSLSVSLILSVLRGYYSETPSPPGTSNSTHSTFTTFASTMRQSHFPIKGVKYVMYRPLYVDSPITLTITRSPNTTTTTAAAAGGETHLPTHTRHRAILWDASYKKAVECIIYPFS